MPDEMNRPNPLVPEIPDAVFAEADEAYCRLPADGSGRDWRAFARVIWHSGYLVGMAAAKPKETTDAG